ncbi:MAG TPA: hypothetical protein VFN09_12695 [Rhodanobacteraceae bacterium]|nr:hypothetical protein [Rhodanobacteraceae bacterium]
MRELETLLPRLEPPSGGLQRLRQAIEETAHPAPARAWRWAAALAAPAVLVALWAPHAFTAHQQARALRAALQQALTQPTADAPIQIAHGAAVELPSGQPAVRLYLVQTAPAPAAITR